MPQTMEEIDYRHLSQQIKEWGKSLGFQQVTITDIDLSETGERLNQWLQKDYQGDMQWITQNSCYRALNVLSVCEWIIYPTTAI